MEHEAQRIEEEVLAGGNVNAVTRVGDTVRRQPSGNPLVYPLLKALQERGFEGAPAYLGTDEAGRDIFGFLPGEVPGNDYPDNPPYMWTDGALAGMARLLRQYHDATERLAALQPERQSRYLSEWRNEVICHNDAAPYNFVFRQGEPVALIDFDMAAPGPRVWDIAYALYTAVPLAGFQPLCHSAGTIPYDEKLHGQDRRRRVALFFESYGMPMPDGLERAIAQRVLALCDALRERAAAGEAAFVKMVQGGHLAHYERELVFLHAHLREWV